MPRNPPKRSSRNSGLPIRQRICILVASLYTVGERDRVQQLLRKEVDQLPESFLPELFIHLSLLLGFPAMLHGLEQYAALNHRKVPRSKSGTKSRADGVRVFKKIYGGHADRVLTNMKKLHPNLPRWILRDTYGRVFTRTGLSLAERELVNVVVLALQGFEKQLYSHLRGALRTGMSPDTLRKSLRLASSSTGISTKRGMLLLSQIEESSLTVA
ncbi:MAG: carboxymuconolactone decarboxylase family protein [Bacteroidota bacterium]